MMFARDVRRGAHILKTSRDMVRVCQEYRQEIWRPLTTRWAVLPIVPRKAYAILALLLVWGGENSWPG
jgi:hypothetical protein